MTSFSIRSCRLFNIINIVHAYKVPLQKSIVGTEGHFAFAWIFQRCQEAHSLLLLVLTDAVHTPIALSSHLHTSNYGLLNARLQIGPCVGIGSHGVSSRKTSSNRTGHDEAAWKLRTQEHWHDKARNYKAALGGVGVVPYDSSRPLRHQPPNIMCLSHHCRWCTAYQWKVA